MIVNSGGQRDNNLSWAEVCTKIEETQREDDHAGSFLSLHASGSGQIVFSP